MMTRLLTLFYLTFFALLTACSGEHTDKVEPLSEEGGLPQSQRTQEDSAAGVKFNAETPFKSLSDTEKQ